MKRILTAVLILITIISIAAVTGSAEEVLYASDEAIRILKLEEGFSTHPYWDYAQWTVGYGTRCPDDKLDTYRQNGISEAEAEELLRAHIAKYESELHAFMIRSGKQLNQQQFDALLLFSYNCGTGWSYETSGVFYNAIVSGATGSTLVNGFARWCNAGGQVKTFLLRRRLCEANIYLNGQYSQTPPDQYGYVLYDGNGGTAKPNVQGYDVLETAQILSVATREGIGFAGWYTSMTGGTKVELLDASVRNARLYAIWGGEPESTTPPDTEESGTTVTVTADSLNVRSGPGTNHPVVGNVRTGDQLVITETAEGSGYLWGKYRGGWVCLQYTTYQETTAPETPQEPAAPAVRMGTVRVNDCLNVRSGPSTGYEAVTQLQNGDRVEILEEKLVGAMRWGRIAQGWISLDYVEMDAQQTPPAEEPEPTQPAETTPPTEPETPTTPQTPATTRTGTVKVSDVLRVRSGPGTDNSVVGYLNGGDRVTVTEEYNSGSMLWGKVESGWICLDYVEFDVVADAPVQSTKGTVKVSDVLRVRTGPGTSYTICAYMENGTQVEITEQRDVNGIVWGKTDQGWICLDYVEMEQQAPSQPESQTRVVTITADCLRVRSGAGTANEIVGYLYQGTKVEILETTTVDGAEWGKTSQGWISMSYVQ